ncbi:MAG: hypothetical protein ACOX17_00865 [Christensenellales bacterium]|jgi:hypothetical protein
MKKRMGILPAIMLCAAVFASCAKEAEAPAGEEAAATEVIVMAAETEAAAEETEATAEETEDETAGDGAEEAATEEPEETPRPSLAPGIEGPEDWPEDIPTPMAGEILEAGWYDDMRNYMVDIAYTQDDINAYAERLQEAGFQLIEASPEFMVAYILANDKWLIEMGDEGMFGDCTFIAITPIE